MVFEWFNEQLLQMKWLYNLIQWLVEDVFELDMATRVGGSIHFFVYDTIKIFILLAALIFIISYIQSYFPPERTKKILGRFNGIAGNVMGALLGTVTPFCSCSSIPLFIGFTQAGLPIGVSFSFLISSPLVDLASVLLLASIFGWNIAMAYVIVGIILAVVGGTIISKLKLEKYVEPFVFEHVEGRIDITLPTLTKRERLSYSKDQVKEIFVRVWKYVLIGVGIGALIHNWIPESVISAVLGQENIFSVLIATLVGVPMYADIFGTIPISEALLYKEVGLGTVLSFMMAVTALSLPSIIMLKNVIKPKLLTIFVGIVVIGIMMIGYGFNAFSFLIM
ncbi:permease [Niameybacter massiliensis]|uniref:Permease n=1 Tax=Holtiella tumoricola TaxID=3018743 RepID=A0AA42J056_9FIRM|nr:permease [Holtiella tumoricola]MDA3731060.1 permease [Holtiella tumoricola]